MKVHIDIVRELKEARKKKLAGKLSPEAILALAQTAAKYNLAVFDNVSKELMDYTVMAFTTVIETGVMPTMEFDVEYIEKPPVHPKIFFSDPYYLGDFLKSIYPCWIQDLIKVCDPDGGIEEWALVGAQGTGKTTAALVAQVYKLYQVSCLRNPQLYYRLSPISTLYFGLFTLNRDKAESELYTKFLAILEQSPYFRDRFPSKRRTRRLFTGNRQDDTVADWHDMELIFPRRLSVVAGSQTSHALSIDLMSCLIDELNWRRKKSVRPEEDMNSAQHLYEQIRTRIRGRFPRIGPVPGLICSISSKQSVSDFMESMTTRMKKEVDTCHISDYAIWEAKPDRIYSGKKFHVFVGNSYGQSKIVDPGDPLYDLTNPQVRAIPVEYRREFEMNINTALRDIAGIATQREVLLFENPALIEKGINRNRTSPFTVDEIPMGIIDPTVKDVPIQKYLDPLKLCTFNGYHYKPLHHPGKPRFIHFDLSKNQDATGMSMGCAYDVAKTVVTGQDGKPVITMVPKVWYDFTISLRAVAGDQMDYEKLRSFVGYLKTLGYNIIGASFDQYQSTDSMQMLTKQGYKTEYISLDKSDVPYLSFRNAFVQGRVDHYHYPQLVDELKQLIHDQEHGKVDHPDTNPQGGPGSKDCADGACGVYMAISNAVLNPEITDKHPAMLNLGQIQPPSRSVSSLFSALKSTKPTTQRIDAGNSNLSKASEFAVSDTLSPSNLKKPDGS